jgi:hypothetical protein
VAGLEEEDHRALEPGHDGHDHVRAAGLQEALEGRVQPGGLRGLGPAFLRRPVVRVERVRRLLPVQCELEEVGDGAVGQGGAPVGAALRLVVNDPSAFRPPRR